MAPLTQPAPAPEGAQHQVPREWVWLVLALVAWVVSRWTVPGWLDLAPWDEASYLSAGQRLLGDGHWPSLEWAPLYAAWYAAWLTLTPSAPAAFLAQWLATDLLATLLLWATARQAAQDPRAALLAVGLWLALPVSLISFPRVAFLGLVLVLGAALVERRSRWAAGAVLLATPLVRPEGVLLLPLWAAVLAWRAGWYRPRTAALVLLAGAALVAVTVALGTSWGDGRTWFAFAQHHAVQAVIYTPTLLSDPFMEYAPFVAREFPGATSLGEALRVAPGRLAWHVLRNIPLLARGLGGARGEGLPTAGATLVSLALAAAMGRRAVRAALPPALLASVALVAPALLILPKPTYLLPTLALGLVALSVAVARSAVWRRRVVPGATAVVVLGACAWTTAQRPPREVKPYLELVEELTPVLPAQSQVLSVEATLCPYLGPASCGDVAPGTLPAELPFTAALSRSSVNAVVVTPRWSHAAGWKSNPDFQRFLKDPSAAGFVRVPEVNIAALYLRVPRQP